MKYERYLSSQERAEQCAGSECQFVRIEYGTKYVNGGRDCTEYFVTDDGREVAVDYDHVSGKITVREL